MTYNFNLLNSSIYILDANEDSYEADLDVASNSCFDHLARAEQFGLKVEIDKFSKIDEDLLSLKSNQSVLSNIH